MYQIYLIFIYRTKCKIDQNPIAQRLLAGITAPAVKSWFGRLDGFFYEGFLNHGRVPPIARWLTMQNPVYMDIMIHDMFIYIYMCVFPVRTIPLKFDMLNGLSKVLVLAVVLPWNPADMQLCFYVSKVCRLWSNGENPASHSALQTGIVR